MKNFHQKGDRLRLFPDRDVSGGEVVIVGDLAGVAFSNYQVADEDGVICDLCGVYTLPKAQGAWAQGDKLYYDQAAKKVTAADDTLPFIGHAADVATADAAEGLVRLKG